MHPYSDDELLSPSAEALKILCIAQEKNLKAISFCDHNVLGAYKELKNIDVKKSFSGKIISGIEFDMVYRGSK